jgi:integrase
MNEQRSAPVPVVDAIERWLAGTGPSGRPESTRRNLRRAMDGWLAYLEEETSHPWQASAVDAHGWQMAMRQSALSAATINHKLSCVSSFYEFALDHGLAPVGFGGNPFRTGGKAQRREQVDPYAAVRALTAAEYRLLIAWLESHSRTLQGARAHALIRTLIHTGWRAGELLAMRRRNLYPVPHSAGAYRYHFDAGSACQFVDILPADCADALFVYLEKAGRPFDSLKPDDFIWAPIRSTNFASAAPHDGAEPICVRTALRVVRAHLRLASISDADTIRLHDLRHTHAVLLFLTGVPAEEIGKRLRLTHKHSTERYLRCVLARDEVDSHSAAFASLRSDPPQR